MNVPFLQFQDGPIEHGEIIHPLERHLARGVGSSEFEPVSLAERLSEDLEFAMKSDPSYLVRFDPTLIITGSQMDPGDENGSAQRQRQNALARLKVLGAAQSMDHNEVPDLGPFIRAA